MADEKMVQNAVLPDRNEEEADENNIEMNDEAEYCSEDEFQALNAQLDRLNTALDFIESKNDNVQAELIELLKSNRETRKLIQESQMDEKPDKTEK